jgi:DNA gyrase subunit A
VVTENGYGKRTPIADYPRKGRGAMGVKTIALTDRKGALAGALVVREHEELVFISIGGMVQRTSVKGISRYGRASQGVRLMNLKDDDIVSAVALIVDDGEEGERGEALDSAASELPGEPQGNGRATDPPLSGADLREYAGGDDGEDDEEAGL